MKHELAARRYDGEAKTVTAACACLFTVEHRATGAGFRYGYAMMRLHVAAHHGPRGDDE